MNDDRPPIFRTWGQVYAALIIYLVMVIALFDQFTRRFNR